MNPEVPPENWINVVDPDLDANVEWSTLVWAGVIGFCLTMAAFMFWTVGNVFLSVVMP